MQSEHGLGGGVALLGGLQLLLGLADQRLVERAGLAVLLLDAVLDGGALLAQLLDVGALVVVARILGPHHAGHAVYLLRHLSQLLLDALGVALGRLAVGALGLHLLDEALHLGEADGDGLQLLARALEVVAEALAILVYGALAELVDHLQRLLVLGGYLGQGARADDLHQQAVLLVHRQRGEVVGRGQRAEELLLDDRIDVGREVGGRQRAPVDVAGGLVAVELLAGHASLLYPLLLTAAAKRGRLPVDEHLQLHAHVEVVDDAALVVHGVDGEGGATAAVLAEEHPRDGVGHGRLAQAVGTRDSDGPSGEVGLEADQSAEVADADFLKLDFHNFSYAWLV